MNKLKKIFNPLLVSLLIVSIAGCSSDSSKVEEEIIASKTCIIDSEDVNQNDNCGILLVGLTDADGDFLNYTVEVTGLELIRKDGSLVSVLTSAQSINFVDYVELTELTAAATIAAGIYTGGSISFDYTNADIQVEKNGVAVVANMLDENGQVLTSQTLQLQFDPNNQLVVSRGRAAMLELDFNLAASHTINLDTDPVTITTEAYIVAEVDPVMNKEFRMRGPLISVSQDESLFRIAIRPFHQQDGRHGGLNIHVNDATNYEIDQTVFVGAEGLTQMMSLNDGTATQSLGIFNRAENYFTALTVMAGTSVAGSDKDAATGVIVARDGNTLTVKGASLIRLDGSVSFHDEITVLIGESTHVSKPRRSQQELTISDLSIGQAVTILGELIINDEDSTDESTSLDASEGAVRMRLTYASGFALANDEVLLTLDLQSLQARSAEIYDFSGTGIDPSFDADPENYEVSIENLMMTSTIESTPVRVAGFIRPFASAPADFEALSVVNYSHSLSQLLIDWPAGEEVIAFSEISSNSLTINLELTEGGSFKLIQGGIRVDLTTFDAAVVIQANSERGIYSLRQNDTVTSYSDFSEFSAMLQQKLDQGAVVDGLHASGGFSSDSLIFSALKLAIKLN